MISEDFIQELIICSKNVIKADRRKMTLENRSYRNNLSLISLDKRFTYKMFMRRSDEFIEDFSVGLIWTNANKHIDINKDIILLRCQGPHDGKKPYECDCHHSFHVHKISLNDIEENDIKSLRIEVLLMNLILLSKPYCIFQKNAV
jgi:hypothetical protein